MTGEGRAGARGEGTDIEGRRARFDQEGRGPGELLSEQRTARAEATEGDRQGGAEGGRAREGQGVDDRVGTKGDRRAHARVLALSPATDVVTEGTRRGGIELIVSQRAEVVAEEDRVGQRPSDAGTVVDRDRIEDRIDGDHEGVRRDAGHRGDGRSDEDTGRTSRHGNRRGVTRPRSSDGDGVADKEARAEAADGSVGEDVTADHHIGAAVAGDHAQVTLLRAADVVRVGDGDVGHAGAVQVAGETTNHEGTRAVAAAETGDGEAQVLARVRGQFDATAAVADVEGRDRLGDRCGAVTREQETSALDSQEPGGLETKSVVGRRS